MDVASASAALQIERHRLDNGLRVVVHPWRRLPLVAVNLWYDVGSKHDPAGRTGLAHLFEHMLFQGSQNVPIHDHFRLIQQVGGVANGSTWYDRTNYYETVPVHCLDLALWLESDRMGHFLPALTPQKLEQQRSVVVNERRQRVDNQPYGRALERLHELLYPEHHPYRWPVIGTLEDIRAIGLDDVVSFFRTYYAPNNAVLTLAGDLDAEEALARVETFFGEIPSGPPAPALEVPDDEPSGARRDVLEDDVQLPRVYAACRLPGMGDRAWYAGRLLAAALSAGKTGRLYADLVYERRLAQETVAYLYPTRESATFLLVATAQPGIDPEELAGVLLAHIDGPAIEALGDRELEKARNQLLTAHFHRLETLDERADLLSQHTLFFDDPQRISEEPRLYAELARRDLVALSQERLRPEARAVVTVVPRSGSR